MADDLSNVKGNFNILPADPSEQGPSRQFPFKPVIEGVIVDCRNPCLEGKPLLRFYSIRLSDEDSVLEVASLTGGWQIGSHVKATVSGPALYDEGMVFLEHVTLRPPAQNTPETP